MTHPKRKRIQSRLLFGMRLIILIKILLIAGPVFAQGKLSGIRKEVRAHENKPKEAEPERKRPRSSGRRNNDSDRDHDHHRQRRRRNRSRGGFHFFADCAPGPQVFHTREVHVYEPVVGPATLGPVVQDPFLHPPASQPVALANDTLISDEVILDDVYESSFQDWGARVTGWYGGGVDDISQGSLEFLFQSPGSIGLDGSFRTVRERGFSDHLWLGDLNVVFEPVSSQDFRLRMGLGFNWLSDSFGSDFGFNLTTGFDAQLSERWILGGEVDLGNLGSADYLHAQLSLGYRLERAELVLGYDHTEIGNVDINSPFVGLRFRY